MIKCTLCLVLLAKMRYRKKQLIEEYMSQKTKIWLKALGVVSAIILALIASGVFNTHKKEVNNIHAKDNSGVTIDQDASGNTPNKRVHKKVDNIESGNGSPIVIKQ